MKAWLLYRPKKIVCEEVPDPMVRENDALVRVKACGVCGSDVHYYEVGKIGRYVVQEPLILGHECAGEVMEVGRSVKHLKPGDRVAIEPGVPCGKCRWCMSGRYNLCPDVFFLATPPDNGAFCELLAHPAQFLHRLPDQLDFAAGAMLEPLSVGVQAVLRARVSLGETVTVLGVGPIGLLTLQVARAGACGKIIAVDLSLARLEMAKSFGADLVLNPERDSAEEAIMELTDGVGTDVCFECAGTQATAELAVRITRRGGKIVFVGMMPEDTCTFPLVSTIDKELDMLGVFRYVNSYPSSIELALRRRVNIKSMITDTFSFEEVDRALEHASRRLPSTIKVMIDYP